MFDNVMQRFLHNQKNIAPDCRGELVRWDNLRHDELASDICQSEIVNSITAQVRYQVTNWIVLWVQCPDDLSDILDYFSGSLRDLLSPCFRFPWVFQISFDKLA